MLWTVDLHSLCSSDSVTELTLWRWTVLHAGALRLSPAFCLFTLPFSELVLIDCFVQERCRSALPCLTAVMELIHFRFYNWSCPFLPPHTPHWGKETQVSWGPWTTALPSAAAFFYWWQNKDRKQVGNKAGIQTRVCRSGLSVILLCLSTTLTCGTRSRQAFRTGCWHTFLYKLSYNCLDNEVSWASF